MGHSSPIFDKNFDAIFFIVSHTRLIHSTCATRLSRKRGFEVFLVTEAAKRGLTIAVYKHETEIIECFVSAIL